MLAIGFVESAYRSPHVGQVVKLFIPPRVVSEGLAFLSLAFDVTGLTQQLGDDRDADGRAALGQMVGNLAEGEVGPENLLPHGVAGCVIAKNGLEILL